MKLPVFFRRYNLPSHLGSFYCPAYFQSTVSSLRFYSGIKDLSFFPQPHQCFPCNKLFLSAGRRLKVTHNSRIIIFIKRHTKRAVRSAGWPYKYHRILRTRRQFLDRVRLLRTGASTRPGPRLSVIFHFICMRSLI